jgi:hypothetical protein
MTDTEKQEKRKSLPFANNAKGRPPRKKEEKPKSTARNACAASAGERFGDGLWA